MPPADRKSQDGAAQATGADARSAPRRGRAKQPGPTVVILVRHRCVRDRDSTALLRRVEELSVLIACDPRDPVTRTSIWSTVESITRRPWGPGAPGAIDRLVVAGAIADALAVDGSG